MSAAQKYLEQNREEGPIQVLELLRIPSVGTEPELRGEAGYTPEQRRSVRPTPDINRYWSGFEATGVNTVRPFPGHLMITCRLVPNQDPKEIPGRIADCAQSVLAAGVMVEPRCFERNGRGYAVPRESASLDGFGAVRDAGYGKPARVVRGGASVPVTAMFREVLCLDSISPGFLLPVANLYAPNEWVRLEDFNQAQRVYASFLSGW